jgi:hypothetical protein
MANPEKNLPQMGDLAKALKIAFEIVFEIVFEITIQTV